MRMGDIRMGDTEKRGTDVILIGFMGAGKTTVGRMLSGRLGLAFLDTDSYIEKQAGITVSQIFERFGEAHFRQMETDVLRRLLEDGQRRVISCGGGLVLREENRMLLKRLGTVIYLQVSPETAAARLAKDTTRPLLQGADAKERIRMLLDKRRAVYEAAADRCIATDGMTPEQICGMILS